MPVPLQAGFTSDQLVLILGTCLPDAAFVVDTKSGSLVAANQALMRLLELDPHGLEELDFVFDRLIHPEDRGFLHTWLDGEFAELETLEIRLRGRGDKIIPVELTLKSIRWQKREYHLGFARACEERVEREARLREQLEGQKERALTALKSSLRVYELNEKIKSTLVLATKLLNVENEEQLFTEAVQILTSEQGLNYQHATFLNLEDGELHIVCSTVTSERKTFRLTDDNKYSRFIRKSCSPGREGATLEEEVLVPLRSRDNLLGLVEVSQYSREKVFFGEYRQITEWQKDMLIQIGDIIALILDNLRLKRELKRQSAIDALTGAYNRNFLMNHLAGEVRRAKRYGRPASLLFVDVDYFKEINDRYGHLQGDQVLRDLGDLFRQNLRETDILCRYGGDEFVILLTETGPDRAQETAHKLIESVREHHFKNLEDPVQRVPVTISAGCSSLRPDQSEEQFLQAVDAALYRAKNAGRNRASIENA